MSGRGGRAREDIRRRSVRVTWSDATLDINSGRSCLRSAVCGISPSRFLLSPFDQSLPRQQKRITRPRTCAPNHVSLFMA